MEHRAPADCGRTPARPGVRDAGEWAWHRRTIAGYTTVDVSVRRARLAGPLDLFVTIDNLLDARYRHLNLRAFTNPEEFAGSPQNPRADHDRGADLVRKAHRLSDRVESDFADAALVALNELRRLSGVELGRVNPPSLIRQLE